MSEETRVPGQPPMRLLVVVGGPLFACVLDFVLLLAVYLVLGAIAPGVLGEVTERPVAWATLINLFAFPLRVLWVALMLQFSAGEPAGDAARIRRHRTWTIVRDVTADLAILAAGAMWVGTYVLDVGDDASLRQIAAISALGPLALVHLTRGLFRLTRRALRR